MEYKTTTAGFRQITGELTQQYLATCRTVSRSFTYLYTRIYGMDILSHFFSSHLNPLSSTNIPYIQFTMMKYLFYLLQVKKMIACRDSPGPYLTVIKLYRCNSYTHVF